MRKFLQIAVCIISTVLSAITVAQTAPSVVISPSAPSSADSITVQISGFRPYAADAYRVSQQNNRLRITLGSVIQFPSTGLPPPLPDQFTYADLGKLPAGTYLVDVVARGTTNQGESEIATGIPLVVSDARASKTAPYVQINYADHWWNPAESGWGLFIWQDKLDRVLAAWFTYGSDNKAEWYTIQVGRWVNHKQYDGQLIKTTGPSFAAFVPGSAVQTQAVGSASLNFTNADNGLFTYTLNGVTQTKNITRFKP